MSDLFPKRSERAGDYNNSYLVTTKSKCITELKSLFQTTMIRDLCSLNTFWWSIGTEMKGGYKKNGKC